MAKTTTSSFNTAHASNTLKPVLLVEIANVTRRYCSGTFANINTTNDKKYIIDFSMTPTTSGIPLNNVSFGQVKFTVLDKDLDVATQIQTNFLDEKTVTIKIGYQSINDTDFVSFDNWKIDTIQPGAEKLSWEFTCSDASKLAYEFTTINKTAVNDASGVGSGSGVTCTVDSTTGFVNPTNIPNAIESYVAPCLIFGREMTDARLYTGISGNDFTGLEASVIGQAQDDNTMVRQGIKFPGLLVTNLPIGLFQAMLFVLCTGSGDGSYYDLTTYDANFQGLGVGLTTSEVDVEAFEAMDSLLYATSVTIYDSDHTSRFPSEFAIYPGMNALETITKMLNAVACYLWVDNGKISVKTFDPIAFRTSFSSVKSFTDDDISSFQYEIEWDPINDIEIKTGFDVIKNSPTTSHKYQITDSVTAYGVRKQQFTIDSVFAWYNSDDSWFKYCYARKWLYVFSNPYAIATFETTKDFKWEPGDQVDFTLTDEVDLTTTPSRGWTSVPGLIVAGPAIRLSSNGELKFTYKAFIWDIIAGLTNYTTSATQIDSGDMDDSTLESRAAVNSATLEAYDAYIDLGTPTAYDSFKITIQWTNPNTAAGENNCFSIALHTQDNIAVSPTDIFTRVLNSRIRYSTDDGNTITRSFYVIDEDFTATSIERIKIDAYDLVEIDGTTLPAIADKPQNMSVVSILPIDLNKTITIDP